MKIQINFFTILTCFILLSCGTGKNTSSAVTHVNDTRSKSASSSLDPISEPLNNMESVKIAPSKKEKIVASDTTFVNLKDASTDFVYDMKYATTANFLKSKVYECDACYLRKKTATALIAANKKFIEMGYRIKLFDCYRPLDIQKKMWEIVSNPEYVADPKKGSIHNRGGAVDITLVDADGKELDMGTPFDFFGIEASHDYELLSDKVKINRKMLRKVMTRYDFRIFESEWWHYNLKNSKKDPLSNFKWKCD